MTANGSVEIAIENGVGTVTFSHPKGNSLPGALLGKLARSIDELGGDPSAHVILLQSLGEKAFCAGASFEELSGLTSLEDATEFFMGFARVILAMRAAPKFVVCRVQGKAVGGGVGLIAAADYVAASSSAELRLSELALGIGPFVIGPAVERKIGVGHFQALALDTEWRDAAWAHSVGLFHALFEKELDSGVSRILERFSTSSSSAMAKLKSALWEGTEHWDGLLRERAAKSAELVLSPYAQQAIADVRAGGKS